MKILIFGSLSDFDKVKTDYNQVESQLRSQGHDVCNPVMFLNKKEDPKHQLKKLISSLIVCQAIYLLPNWVDHPQHRLVYCAANETGVKLFNESDYFTNLPQWNLHLN